MRIIVGLGNPEDKYKYTRHNAGYLALDYLAEKAAALTGETLSWEENHKLKSLVYKNGDLLFIKPLTYMNNSGQAVQATLAYYKLLPTKLAGFVKIKDSDLSAVLTVIQDEIDLPLGELRISKDSGSAGHRGIESIIHHLHTKKFNRLRLGINSNNRGPIPTDKFVLQKFSETELALLNKTISTISL